MIICHCSFQKLLETLSEKKLSSGLIHTKPSVAAVDKKDDISVINERIPALIHINGSVIFFPQAAPPPRNIDNTPRIVVKFTINLAAFILKSHFAVRPDEGHSLNVVKAFTFAIFLTHSIQITICTTSLSKSKQLCENIQEQEKFGHPKS